MPYRPTFGAVFGHFEPFWALLGLFWPFLASGPGPHIVGVNWRLDPLLGPFLVILSHFWPFWAFFGPFWPFGEGQGLQVGRDPLKLG